MECRKEPVVSASEQENKRDEYQGCSHVETVPQRINDEMNEQAKGIRAATPNGHQKPDRKRVV